MIRTCPRRRFAALGLAAASALAPPCPRPPGADRRRDQEEGRDQRRPAGRLPALRHGQRAEPARRLRRRRRAAARQGLGRQGQARAGDRPEPHPVPADQQGRPADRLARDHARARQAGAVLQAVRRGDDRAARPKKTNDQGPGRPQGRCSRRRPRQHAGHRADRRSRRRAPRSAASTTTPRPCRR